MPKKHARKQKANPLAHPPTRPLSGCAFKLPEIDATFDPWLAALPADGQNTEEFKYITFVELPPEGACRPAEQNGKAAVQAAGEEAKKLQASKKELEEQIAETEAKMEKAMAKLEGFQKSVTSQTVKSPVKGSIQHVHAFLRNLGVDEGVCAKFRKERVDVEVIRECSDEDLTELGLSENLCKHLVAYARKMHHDEMYQDRHAPTSEPRKVDVIKALDVMTQGSLTPPSSKVKDRMCGDDYRTRRMDGPCDALMLQPVATHTASLQSTASSSDTALVPTVSFERKCVGSLNGGVGTNRGPPDQRVRYVLPASAVNSVLAADLAKWVEGGPEVDFSKRRVRETVTSAQI
mmetsp:Transcript_74127/g.120364  ORF Transcript_74127/g.120364 Transcript_74127/m.120364 type:complete len:348 (-) Transcript_74127:154-1197(-)